MPKIVTTCPVTGVALYVADVKPGLLHKGAKGDWGYDPRYGHAVELTPHQAKAAMRDMLAVGRKPVQYD